MYVNDLGDSVVLVFSSSSCLYNYNNTKDDISSDITKRLQVELDVS
jgi:hypothetical protein